jgi:DNA polymerase I-like protein with 3'-5' exonuclease and polymerase domains
MAKDLMLQDSLAKTIFDTINTMYSKAADYLLKSDEKAKTNNWQDCLGRKRNFEFSYQARNAEIQGPAAIFCQEHLIKLHRSIKDIGKLHASIHDGFIVSCKKEMSEEVKDVVRSVLESKSDILQNLSVPVSSGKDQVLCNIL